MRRPVHRSVRRAGARIAAPILAFAAIFLAGLGAPPIARAADSNALWTIVHGVCVSDQLAFGHPAPCAAVDLAAGYAVLKDISGHSQYLLIPTDRVSGVESPKLLAATAPNYFYDAWKARSFVLSSLGQNLPREDLGLAINSVYGRSQNQLHIHIDCVRPDVRRALDAQKNRIGRRWSAIALPPAGHRYRAMRVASADLANVDPFKLLARTDAQARADMGRETLVAIGADFSGRPGFYLLSDRATLAPPNSGSGEELLDHSCALARPAASGSRG